MPRWLPLAPAPIGVITLVPYGLLGLGHLLLAAAGALTVRPGALPTSADAVLVGWIGFLAFAGHGPAQPGATRSYRLRTRPREASPDGSSARAPPGPIRTVHAVNNPDKLRHTGPAADAWAAPRTTPGLGVRPFG